MNDYYFIALNQNEEIYLVLRANIKNNCISDEKPADILSLSLFSFIVLKLLRIVIPRTSTFTL